MFVRKSMFVLVLGLVAATAAQAWAGLNPSNHANWVEDYGFYSGTVPASAVEWAPPSGFGSPYDEDGRLISNAAVTQNTVDGTVLTSISSNLFALNDANLYKIQITNPAAFSASITSTSAVLALFAADGTALAASVGGSANPITGTYVPSPGQYFIGVAVTGGYPQNNAGQNLFGLTSGFTGVTGPSVLSDLKLATDPTIAWTLPGAGATYLIGDTSFTAPGATISLAGANFSVTPEPTVLGLLGLAGVLTQLRRRRAGA